MTNAEKYLKDGVDVKRFAEELAIYMYNSKNTEMIDNFLNETIKPILTEDEKVILRNIKEEYSAIGRKDGTPSIELYIKGKGNDDFKHCWCFYNQLFQFIKPRRRI